jgi:hypothetical protein
MKMVQAQNQPIAHRWAQWAGYEHVGGWPALMTNCVNSTSTSTGHIVQHYSSDGTGNVTAVIITGSNCGTEDICRCFSRGGTFNFLASCSAFGSPVNEVKSIILQES